MPHIQLRCSRDGDSVAIKCDGFSGSDCLITTRDLEEKLGVTDENTRTRHGEEVDGQDEHITAGD